MSADKETASAFSEQLKNILSGYGDKDVFYFNESGLFYKLLPDRTLAGNNSDLQGLKKEKHRVSILFGVSKLGEKMPILLIGKACPPEPLKIKILMS